MFDWQKMCADTAGYSGLHEELRRCPGRYIFENVKMPESCQDRICTVEFRYYDEDHIKILCPDSPVQYNGSDPRIAQWLETGVLEFGSFDQLAAFLALFNKDGAPHNSRRSRIVPNRAAVPAASETVTVPERPEMEYDRDNITVPDTHKSYIDFDRDKLILALNSEIFGQEDAIRKIVHLIHNHLGTKKRTRPISIFLYGPTGTGKSDLIRLMVNELNKQLEPEDQFYYKQFDCTQCKKEEDISKLIGSAPGYIGFDEPGVFSVLEDHPNTVFVFEEIEKGAGNVTEVIMQAMENGKQETNGKTLRNGENFYDLSHAIIFFTSNIVLKGRDQRLGFGSSAHSEPEPVRSVIVDDSEVSIARMISRETREAKSKLADTGKFRREVISRMEAIIRFNDLTGDIIADIAAKCIRMAAEEHLLYVRRIDTPILQEFINSVSGEAEGFGARELRREARNFFGSAFRECSHTHDDHAKIIVSGTIDNVEILPCQ